MIQYYITHILRQTIVCGIPNFFLSKCKINYVRTYLVRTIHIHDFIFLNQLSMYFFRMVCLVGLVMDDFKNNMTFIQCMDPRPVILQLKNGDNLGFLEHEISINILIWVKFFR